MIAFFACNPFPFVSPVRDIEVDKFGYVTYQWQGSTVKHRPLFVRDDEEGGILASKLGLLKDEYDREGPALSVELVEKLRTVLIEAGCAHLNLARLDSLEARLDKSVPDVRPTIHRDHGYVPNWQLE